MMVQNFWLDNIKHKNMNKIRDFAEGIFGPIEIDDLYEMFRLLAHHDPLFADVPGIAVIEAGNEVLGLDIWPFV